MIRITEDEIVITGPNGSFTFQALGGPDDPIGLIGDGDLEMTAEEWQQLQYAFVNFSNTGSFDEEV